MVDQGAHHGFADVGWYAIKLGLRRETMLCQHGDWNIKTTAWDVLRRN